MGVMRAFMWVLYTNLYVSYKGAVVVWVFLRALIYLAICVLHRFQFNCIGNINDVSKQI